MNCKKTILKCVALLVAVLLPMPLSACGKADDSSLLPAYGVGRVTTAESQSESETEPVPVPDTGYTICVDPGHGYEDGGTGSEFLGDVLEKDINLIVALKLKGYLEALGFDVVMTHDGKSFPTTSIDDGNNRFKPEERTAYANSLGNSIDYYISLHCNAFDDPSVYGTIVYYVDDATKGTVGDTEIASSIADSLTEDLSDGKVSSSVFPYYVIRYTGVPASLIEMGFVTNENDAKNLLDDAWQDKIAKSIADGINDYFVGDDTDSGGASDEAATDPIAATDTEATIE